jgi:hypothetical protein
MKHIDSIRRPQVQQSKPLQPKSVGTGARFTAFATKTRRRKIAWGIVLTVLLSPLLFVLAMIGLIGIAAVVVYGVVALIVRVPSRNSFALALAALIYMIVLQLAAAQVVAQGMAVLAYILLAIGAISLAREVKISSRLRFKKH